MVLKLSQLFLIGLLSTMILSSCYKFPTDNIDFDIARSEILNLHNSQREYHFKKDSIAFANQLSDNFISVNRGEISTPERAATISRYNSYFSSVEFNRWDDVTEPIINFSNDGSMAYTIVNKIVELSYQGQEGEIINDTTHFAWTAIFKKYGEEWKIDCVTSTNKS
tara:strand:+ start:498 stop:995 length:498 start_codon:yes stop_codon:yes gene_type:complete